jgi:hypothetical protein
MAGAARILAVGLLLGLTVTARVGAQGAGSEPLMVLVDDHAGVSADILQRALDITGKIFKEIDVDIIWLKRGDARLKETDVLRSVVIVHVFSREMADRAPFGLLGIAASGTRFARVFYNRIEDLSPGNEKATACMLGHVVAHELGHLLLPPKSHSATGIMRAGLNGQIVEQGNLGFGANQAHLIKANLSANLAAARAK